MRALAALTGRNPRNVPGRSTSVAAMQDTGAGAGTGALAEGGEAPTGVRDGTTVRKPVRKRVARPAGNGHRTDDRDEREGNERDGNERDGNGRRYSGLSAAERAQQRRGNLLSAALELFADQGYGSTSIEQICQAASVGLKGFYDEFGTKERLLLALYEELYDAVVLEFFTEVDSIEPHDGSDRQLMGAWVRATVRDPRAAKVMMVESVGASAGSEAFRQVTRRKMAEQVAKAYAMGLFGRPVVDPLPPSLALALTGGLLELVRDWIFEDGAVSVDQLTDRVVQFCRSVFAGLRVEAD